MPAGIGQNPGLVPGFCFAIAAGGDNGGECNRDQIASVVQIPIRVWPS
jgi:hypothetical protein